MESLVKSSSADSAPLCLQLLGAVKIARGNRAVALPKSRKVRALLAYLALAPRPVRRSQLAELLWDVPDDPRGELRWCLSKIRSALDQPGRKRVLTQDDAVWLDLSDCAVDAIEIADATREGVATLPSERQRALAALFQGEFLEGLEVDRNPAFGVWLTAQRRRFRGCHAALLEQLAMRRGGVAQDEALGYLEKWVQLAPFDRRVHELLLTVLARRGQLREGEQHLAATATLFEAEGLDCVPLREAWRAARAAAIEPTSRIIVASEVPIKKESAQETANSQRRASIAVMPFTDVSAEPDGRGGVADALAHDVTTRLAKLRSMFVIAQGSAFALHERHIGPEEAGRMLNVEYVVGGSVRRQGTRFTVLVELVETRTARIVWSETLNTKLDDALLVLDEIGNRIVASIANEVETLERNRAILRPPNSLDAWEAHHRGLWHMYRFTKDDNERAQQFFQMAVRLDPTFARAYAGLSFTHFQNAFLNWGQRGPEMDKAFETAAQGLMVDDRDPAAHWAVGRAHWLRGDNDQAMTELRHSIDLSPNFALAHYTLAFVQSQAGDPAAAISSVDFSRTLSPFDPLLFGMFASRAMALARQGNFDEAAAWGVKAAARPNAHAHIFAIAALSLSLAGSLDEAGKYIARIRKAQPHYGVVDFLEAFRIEPQGVALFKKAGKQIGMA